jgi:membrane associated rhomboid family serine protease
MDPHDTLDSGETGLQNIQSDESPPSSWQAYVPGVTLLVCMWVAWIVHLNQGGMTDWAVSASALAQRRYQTIALHMIAHGGLFHILMNSAVLLAISGPLVSRLGPFPESWLRFIVVFILSGLAGMSLYLLIHPQGVVPMLGASGAIYGLLGLLLRSPLSNHPLLPLRSPEMVAIIKTFVKDNLFLILLLTVPAMLQGKSGGVAWEAHLGGFLFGLLFAPYLLPRDVVIESN